MSLGGETGETGETVSFVACNKQGGDRAWINESLHPLSVSHSSRLQMLLTCNK